MGQIAYYVSNGEMVEAFSVTDIEWDAICPAPKGMLLMPRTRWPAVAKTSIRGLRFFAQRPGYPERLPVPESHTHVQPQLSGPF